VATAVATTRRAALIALVGAFTGAHAQAPPRAIAPSALPRVAEVDERFQSYNVEMVEVIGGWFWKPYGARTDPHPRAGSERGGAIPAGMDPALYEYRPPIDLADPRLRKLAAALGPAYVRVSGTWANSVFFHDSDAPPPGEPPAGFGGILTRPEWKGVVEFSRAVDAKIMTSFATSLGTRDGEGVWAPEQARHLLAYTRTAGGAIAAAELMNEPTYAAMGGAPEGYDARMYGRDVGAFRRFVREAAPDVVLLGPGSVGEGGLSPISLGGGMLRSEDLLAATGPAFDVFSYHLYAAVSKRCARLGPATQTTADDALSEEWLSRADGITAFYVGLRDRFEPGKPLWITETADAACGGNPWAATFLDTFRYLDWHGRLARRGVTVIAHNTLASSDYGLLSPDGFAPRPSYWAALLWARLMGQTVLDPGPSQVASVHMYAHCLRGRRGGVALLAINLDRRTAREVALSSAALRHTLTAARLLDRTVRLNGRELRLGRDGAVPRTDGVPVPAGRVRLEPASITFLAMPDAGNAACN
jgi:heparanase